MAGPWLVGHRASHLPVLLPTQPSAQVDDDNICQELLSVPFMHYTPGYQMDTMSHRKVKKIAPGHKASVGQDWDPNPGRRAMETYLSQERRCCRARICPPGEQSQVTLNMEHIRAQGWSKPRSEGHRFPSV